jgi:biotin carboxyl carrier protein
VSLDVGVEDERAARLAQFSGRAARAAGREVIAAPMPGLVVRVNVEAGQAVTAGESLVVLQAMKMENELASPRGGTVKAVVVEPGQAVEPGQVLVELD